MRSEDYHTQNTSNSPVSADVFDDFEARENIVGLFDLLYKIDHRNNPALYEFRSENAYD